MGADQQDDARLTNSEILRELRQDSAKHGTALAVVETQVSTILKLVERWTEQFDTLTSRIVGTENADIDIRARLTTLESRPAMTPEERQELKAQVAEHEKRITTNDLKLHNIELRDLSVDQKDDLRQFLNARERQSRWRDEVSVGAALQAMTPFGLLAALAVAHYMGWS